MTDVPKNKPDRQPDRSFRPGGQYWSTSDELHRLQGYADVDPLQLLAAYNGTRLRSNWGTMDGEVIKAEASRLAKWVLLDQDGLMNRIPEDWPFAKRLAEAVLEGRNG